MKHCLSAWFDGNISKIEDKKVKALLFSTQIGKCDPKLSRKEETNYGSLLLVI